MSTSNGNNKYKHKKQRAIGCLMGEKVLFTVEAATLLFRHVEMAHDRNYTQIQLQWRFSFTLRFV